MVTSRKPPHRPGHGTFPQGPRLGCVELAPRALCTLVFVLSQAWGWSPAFVGQGGDPSPPGPQASSRLAELRFGSGTWGQALSKG